MRHLNGVYTQAFNRRHGLSGHLFQGRFKAIVVDRDAYLLSLCRYVERNPVAAKLVKLPWQWRWSSCRAHVGQEPAPAWLDIDGVHSLMLQRSIHRTADRRRAIERYAELVADESTPSPWSEGLRQQIFLGDEDFVARTLAQTPPAKRKAGEVPRTQRIAPSSIAQWLTKGCSRQDACNAAYRQGGFTMSAIAAHYGISVSSVSRMIAQALGSRTMVTRAAHRPCRPERGD
jgi:hypothetical protein